MGDGWAAPCWAGSPLTPLRVQAASVARGRNPFWHLPCMHVRLHVVARVSVCAVTNVYAVGCCTACCRPKGARPAGGGVRARLLQACWARHTRRFPQRHRGGARHLLCHCRCRCRSGTWCRPVAGAGAGLRVPAGGRAPNATQPRPVVRLEQGAVRFNAARALHPHPQYCLRYAACAVVGNRCRCLCVVTRATCVIAAVCALGFPRLRLVPCPVFTRSLPQLDCGR
jgi:hypothetical protein